MARSNGVSVMGELLAQSRTLGRMEGTMIDLDRRVVGVEHKLESLPLPPPSQRIPLTKLLPYLYGSMVILGAIAGRVEWPMAVKIARALSH